MIWSDEKSEGKVCIRIWDDRLGKGIYMSRYMKSGAAAILLAMAFLTGCGADKAPQAVETNTIIISDKGTVTSCLVEGFDKDKNYFNLSDLSGLASLAMKEAAEYNTEHQKGETVPVSVEKVEALQDGSNRVMVQYKFDSTETYVDYNQYVDYNKRYNETLLFYGTVKEALEKGYDLDAGLKSVKDETVLSKEQLLQNQERHVLITKERAAVYCPLKVSYISEGAVYNADGSVDTTQTEDIVVILMK